MTAPAVRLFVGGHGTRYAGAVLDLHGDRCCSAAHRPFGGPGTLLDGRLDPTRLRVLLDSGAFTDPPARRLTVAAALERQLIWEREMARRLGEATWRVEALVSYDVLIDEVWLGPTRVKRRWSVTAAEQAVAQTIEAARYLASRRDDLAPRTLVLAVQGVDVGQYVACTRAVLDVARPGDWLGLGGWCILGRWQRAWLPTFWATLRAVLPLTAAAGVGHVHVFGVLWLPALGGLLWLADRHGLTISTDSARPLMDVARGDPKRAGARGATWRESVSWWRAQTAGLRARPEYREPPHAAAAWARQLALWDVAS